MLHNTYSFFAVCMSMALLHTQNNTNTVLTKMVCKRNMRKLKLLPQRTSVCATSACICKNLHSCFIAVGHDTVAGLCCNLVNFRISQLLSVFGGCMSQNRYVTLKSWESEEMSIKSKDFNAWLSERDHCTVDNALTCNIGSY